MFGPEIPRSAAKVTLYQFDRWRKNLEMKCVKRYGPEISGVYVYVRACAFSLSESLSLSLSLLPLIMICIIDLPLAPDPILWSTVFFFILCVSLF